MKKVILLWRYFINGSNFRNLMMLGLMLPFRFAGLFLPKTNRVVFGARYGIGYDWDPKYIFEYACAHQNQFSFEPVWATRSAAIARSLSDKGLPVVGIFSLKGIIAILRAKAVVIATSGHDIDAQLVAGRKIVHTYHGIPIRKVSNDFLDTHISQVKNPFARGSLRILQRIFYLLRREDEADYIITSSTFANGLWQSQYNHDPSKYRVLGVARNDGLFDSFEPVVKQGEQVVISYLPTIRESNFDGPVQSVMDLFTLYGFDVDEWDRFLGASNAKLVLKLHHRQASDPAVKALFRDAAHIEIYPEADMIPLFRETDILISDYSSVCFNFLMLNRPMIFAAFDYASYAELPGFTLDYDAFMPGYQTRDWPSVKDAIGEILEGNDRFEDHRKQTLNQMYEHQDGNSAKRICEFLDTLME